jgi:hypothetical protein
MSLRTFTDAQGNEWQAFDVVPRDVERRSYDRRSSAEVRVEDADRREEERRLSVGRRPTRLSNSEGWLVFEQGGNRRRLSPIPSDWMKATDAALEQYCKAAKPVKRVHFA